MTKNYKIKIYPNNEQKKIINNWLGTSRFVYNRALSYINQENSCSHKLEYLFNPYHKYNFYDMRDLFVTKKNNEDFLNEWEFLTPKDIRAGSIKELTTNLSTNVKKIKNNNLKKFQLRFKRKNDFKDSITIPKSAIKFKNENLHIFGTFIKNSIKIGNRTKKKNRKLKLKDIKHDCKLCFNGIEYFLLIPVDKKVQIKKDENKIIALDPGVRTFQTCFSEREVIETNFNNYKFEKLKKKISILQNLKDTGKKNKRKIETKIKKKFKKISNLVDDLHWKLITYLRKNYNDILIPIFKSQELVSKMFKNMKSTKNKLLSFKHYLFRTRLIEKAKEYTNLRVYTIKEDYTSKTCSNCGNVNYKKNSSKIFKCSNCNIKLDRDINGSRNIFIRYSELI